MKCPVCFGKLIETIKKFKHVTDKAVYSGDWFVYECEKCKEIFTTTESDERSLKQLNQKKL